MRRKKNMKCKSNLIKLNKKKKISLKNMRKYLKMTKNMEWYKLIN